MKRALDAAIATMPRSHQIMMNKCGCPVIVHTGTAVLIQTSNPTAIYEGKHNFTVISPIPDSLSLLLEVQIFLKKKEATNEPHPLDTRPKLKVP